MKKLINAPDAVVREALEGIELAYGDRLRVSYDPAFIVRADAPVEGKVGLVSGGGSGHERRHGGARGGGGGGGRWRGGAPGGSRCTGGSSVPACSTRLVQAKCSLRLHPT